VREGSPPKSCRQHHIGHVIDLAGLGVLVLEPPELEDDGSRMAERPRDKGRRGRGRRYGVRSWRRSWRMRRVVDRKGSILIQVGRDVYREKRFTIHVRLAE